MKLKLLVLCLVSGCGVDVCRQKSATVTTGIAGCVTEQDDSGASVATVKTDFGVQVFDVEPNDSTSAIASTKSDAHGFYEVALTPGHYWLCTDFRRCTQQDVQANTVNRVNYEFSAAPGWSN